MASSVNEIHPDISIDSFMSNVHIYRITSQIELLALLNLLESRLDVDPSIRLIVLDSVAFHFRNAGDMAQRARILNGMAQTLRRLASVFNVAIVLTNQMTTKMLKRPMGENAVMVPALGLNLLIEVNHGDIHVQIV